MKTDIPAIFLRNDNRPNYRNTVQTGLIISLIAVIITFKMEISPPPNFDDFKVDPNERVNTIDIPITEIKTKPPKPLAPKIPAVVPNETIIEEDPLVFDSEIDFEASLPIPPPVIYEDEEEVFPIYDVERKPVLIGGLSKLQKSITYPEMALKARIEGTVIIGFKIDKRGNVINPTVLRGIGGGCDEEALKAVQKAKFTPGLQRGRPVKVAFTIPIRFKISD